MAEKQTEILITGFVGILGTFVGMLATRALNWWDRRRDVNRTLHRYRRLIECADSPSDVSVTLFTLKRFLLTNDGLLEGPKVKAFFETWLRDAQLETKQKHSRFNDMATSPTVLAQLRADAAMLTK